MDDPVDNKLFEHKLSFKICLDRIFEKYGRVSHQDEVLDVNLNSTEDDVLIGYLDRSFKNIGDLQPKSATMLTEQSIDGEDHRGYSQFDNTYKDAEVDETCCSSNHSVGKENMQPQSFLDASSGSFYDDEFQPEDKDEMLQMSLNSNGSLLMDLYPSMVSRVEKALHQKHVSVAADSVLRRYRRWREQSKPRQLNSTFDVTLKQPTADLKSPNRMSLKPMRNKSRFLTFLKASTSQCDGQWFKIEKDLPKREAPINFCALNLSKADEPIESLVDKTFTICELTLPKLPHHTASETAVRKYSEFTSSKRPSFPIFKKESPIIKDKSFIHNSPLKESPSKLKLMASLPRFSKSPIKNFLDRCSQQQSRGSHASPSCPESPIVQLRWLQPEFSRPQPDKAAETPSKRRRRLSFDSFFPPKYISAKEIDDNFLTLYHKFACQSKSQFFSGPPCHLCIRDGKSQRDSSSSLAALALSPHRSLLRKRFRELAGYSHSPSKRLREESCTSSPGSKRHVREMLRRRLSEYELPCQRLAYSPNKTRILHQGIWDDQEQRAVPDSFDNRNTNGYSPRRWR